MFRAILNMARLSRAGFTILRHGARVVPDDSSLPGPVQMFARVTAPMRRRARAKGNEKKLSAALTDLGPSYIKLGQFLATRDDVVGPEIARDLAQLQDKLPPFSMSEARRAVKDALGESVEELFAEFSESVAAASIAQVHKAAVREADGTLKPVAVKILRPRVEARFRKDLESYYFAARMIERFHPPMRRLRPYAIVDTLAKSVAIEMDLRMEAAAISEMAENIANDEDFRVPGIDWARNSRRVLTLEWIDGIPLSDHGALKAAGHDLKKLGTILMQSFLKHAMRDGFFHADMHPGNLFVDKQGRIVAVDFGIMGRLTPRERRFLAEILHGFITRNYTRVSEVHFEAGYIPRNQSVELFAQALRAIGEPLMDRTADEISMALLLGQLLQYTEVFEMETQPQLLMLQKTMVVVEGVARSLDPQLNMWTTSEPVVTEWMEKNLGVEGKLQDAAEGVGQVGQFVGEIPKLLGRAEMAAEAFADMAHDGIRLDQGTISRLAEEQSRQGRSGNWALWIGALSLAAIAAAM
ncbi:MAG TPA: 2-polyprenylphenol 6-hydroxylase, partial [Rhizobiales bacterium]|nr:2-polyprenylphenol 6-hydroxylase [Hyphomicrobiales bacterium]